MMKILLVGNGHRLNRGCEAITLTTIDMLRKKMPDVEIEILSFEPEIDRYFEKFDIKVSNLRDVVLEKYLSPSLFMKIMRRSIRFFSSINYHVKYSGLLPYIKKLEDCDLVLSLGGDNYTNDYGNSSIFYWNLAALAKRFHSPFVIWGASVGPFTHRQSINEAKRGLQNVTLITAREGITVKYLKKINYKGKVVRVFDSAFTLQTKVCNPFPGFPRQAETIGFNISPIYYRYTSKSSDEILTISKKFLHKISKKYNILLIPHVVSKIAAGNDALYMRPIAEEIDNAILASPNYNCRELKYLISRCEFFIGARTHATIAAFSSAVPTLSLGYSVKAVGLNKDLFGSDAFLLEAHNFCLENLFIKFDYLEKNHTAAKNILIAIKDNINAMAYAGVEELMNLL